MGGTYRFVRLSVRTAHYRAVSPKINRRQSISTVGGRLTEKSTVGGRLSKKKGRRRRRRGKEERIPISRASSTKTNLHKWAAEITANGTFSTPLGSGGPGGLPVPYLVIGNKTDIVAKVGTRVMSSGNLVNVARQWVEKQGLLPSSEQLPLTDSFPGNSDLLALIRRMYISDELPDPSPWSISPLQNPIYHTGENLSDDDHYHRRLSSSSSEGYKYDVLPLLPAHRSLTPPAPTLYPQLQPLSVPPENYSFHRLAATGLPRISSTKLNKADTNN
ncbi:hypothetical protein GW17_00036125 [Ensete ventricosum]|nr:hypothetical protein GW17_00036125 [Ensete ventricosum]RZS11959.1 hypothetical protein BHM03_00043337 [Ensete ventricosum]